MSRNELSIRISGEAGQGMQTIGMGLCQLFKNCGLQVFATQDYMSRIRGGNNFFQVRVSQQDISAARLKSDILIALDANSVNLHKKDILPGGIIILDKEKYKITDNDPMFFDAPIYGMAKKSSGSEFYVNSVAFGVLAGVLRAEFPRLEQVLRESFSKKSKEIIDANIAAASLGFNYAKENFKGSTFEIESRPTKPRLMMNANEAIALGAIKAGCKFYAAYPMTPATSIMNVVSYYAQDFNIIVEQAEDEIAAVNMIIGASFAGARSMTATSGGGFALMVEGLSLAAITETPIVIVDSQRPAPATGLPTRTEQADLELLLYAGHGEFARVLFSPGSLEEAFYLTIKAFNLAEKYQVPVLILTDQYLADSMTCAELFDPQKIRVERFLFSEKAGSTEAYQRYALTESGISPRAIPSFIQDVVYADSDEHTPQGHITESAEVRVRMMDKRFYKRMELLKKEITPPTTFNLEKAEIILAGYGSTLGVLREFCLDPAHKNYGFIHFSQVWPFPETELSGIFKRANPAKIYTVENNASGQLAKLIRQQMLFAVSGTILKFDGRPFTLDDLEARLKELKNV